MMTGTVGRLNTQLTELQDTLSYALIPRYGNAIRTLSSPGNGYYRQPIASKRSTETTIEQSLC